MIYSNKLLAQAKIFCRDTTATMIMAVGAAMPVVIVTSGVGMDLLSVQMKENAAASQLNSVGTFASSLNTCTGQTNTTTCAATLQTQINAFAKQIGADNLTATVTPGLWCTPSSGSPSFIAVNASCSGSSVAAVKVSGTFAFDTRFLRLFGLPSINRKMDITLADDKMTGITTANICPSIVLNEEIIKSSSAGDVLWSEKSQSPRSNYINKITLKSGITTQSFSGELGNTSTYYPFFLVDPSGSLTSWPASERLNSTTTQRTSISKPSGTDFDLTAGTKYRRFSYPFSTTNSDLSKNVTDRDYGSRLASDNGGPAILRELKKNWEGKTCMAMIGHDNGDGTITIKGSVPFTFDVVCDGMRKRSGGNWVAYKDNGSTVESKCSYSSDVDKVDISISGWLGDNRTSDSIAYTPSDRNKWGAQTNGRGSVAYVRGTNASTNKVDDKRSYQ